MPDLPASYDDLRALPDGVKGQLIGGVLYMRPWPSIGHGVVATSLGMDLGNPFGRGRGGPGGWVFLDEPELHFGKDVVVPDLAGWRRERLTVPPANTPFLTIAPDWVCEVLSPSTASMDRVLKKRVYTRAGVGFYWLIDPIERVLTAYRLEGEHLREIDSWGGDEDALVRVPPFDAIELDLRALWPPPPTP